MIENLALATAMVCLTVVIHFTGLFSLMHLLRMRGHLSVTTRMRTLEIDWLEKDTA